MNKNLKNNLVTSFQSMLICLLLFWLLKVPIEIYAGLVVLSFFTMGIQIHKKLDENIEVFQKFLSVLLGSGISFCYLNSSIFPMNYYLCFFGGNIFILGILYCCLYQGTDRIKLPKLFKNREHDLTKIKWQIANWDISIIGIEAVWGEGKTFFVEKLKEEFSKDTKYEFITIDVLACNLDILPQILVEEIERALYDNQILPKCSKDIKRFFSKNKNIEILGELLSEPNESYAHAFDCLKRELEKIEKTIVIVYEDIDRILDSELIKKIFYISEKLTYGQKNIKVIYQYNPIHLKMILGEDVIKAGFLEKYIPYTVSLSGSNFLEVMNRLLEEKKVPTERLNEDDFRSLDKDHIDFVFYMDKVLTGDTSINEKVMDTFTSIQSIRKAEHFFTELNEVLVHEKFLLEYKNIVRNVIFTKHFFPQVYGQFKAWKIFDDYFKVKLGDGQENKNSIPMEIAIKDKKIKELNEDDFEKYIVYRLLTQNQEKKKTENNFYEQITRIIRHLLEPWQAAMTDYNWIVENMIPVLEMDLNAENVEEEYRKVTNDLVRNHSFYKENNRLLVDAPWALYFRAFDREFIKDEKEYFEKLLDLYFKIEQPKNIDERFFSNLQPIFEYMPKNQLNVFLEKMIALGTGVQYEGKKRNDFFGGIEKAIGWHHYFDNEEMVDEMVGSTHIYSVKTFIQIKNQLMKYENILNKYGRYIKFDKVVIRNILEFCNLVINTKLSDEIKPEITAEKEERLLNDYEFLEEMKTADDETKDKLITQYVENRSDNIIHILKVLKKLETD